MRSLGLSLAFLLLTTLPLHAGAEMSSAALAQISLLQPPVWLDRDGRRYALAAGNPIYAGDSISTGPGARIQITLEDQSIVKLGENTRFDFTRLEIKPDADDANVVLSGALSVLRGAFRFTTSAVGKLRKREFDVSVGPTITAGIRGTDIWGKSDDDQELLCLLEGNISVTSPGHDAVTMDQAKTFYVVPRGKDPLPVVPTPEGKLESWMPQTDLNTTEPALSANGSYQVGIESFTDADAAQETVRLLAVQGYATEVVHAQIKGKTWYRIVVSGLAAEDDARDYVKVLKRKLKIRSPWVIAPTNL